MREGLVAAARAGDGHAFACLLEQEVPAVQRAVLAIVRSPDEAQDVIQEASIRAWRQLGSLRDDERWAAWYRRIVIRVALDHAGGRRARDVDLDAVGELWVADSTAPSADRLALLAALATLPSDDRALLGLRFGADLEVPDVAAALDIPLGTAKSRLHRALRRLAEAMGDPDVD